ncbi:hypothetical protein BD324DRAFT_205595 [Kockovaella imperatae]|uniref:HSF-type DNA-binding domain-containing protein n=1 Tax=Kockovaella imperatae TaxID=4999 RepID=A0A1Y1U9T7_9TREE|nr:hypothetical protein BD324DRAFT_205595 [Kockovaella imperatae]ORX33845.1 hypothetical protein BD324DRAFT_205595 [Kockovaella imperatae]
MMDLQIYGFMRKVSLRHVDKDINDPDASTWAHPFLKRSSTAEQVLGFKRRVPPRPPQAGKRQSSSVQDQNDPYRDDAPMHGLSPSPSDPGNTYQSPPEMYQPHQLGSLGEDEPASFPFNPSLVQSYPPPTGLQSVYAPPARPAFYMTSSSGGSSDCLGGSLPSRPVYFTSHPADPSMPSTLVEGGVPIPPDASTSTVFMSSNVRTAPQSGINSYPQTAPPYATTFPDIAKVTQGHLRTRSVQGEPPSATIMSPSSQPTLGANFGYVDFDDVALRLGGDVPTYDPQDAATWVRRGYNDIHTGEPVPSLGFREVNPNMVPYQFAPTLLSPDSTTADAFSPQSQIAETYTFPPAVEANKSHTATPRAMPIRMGRNDTRRASGSPYSPRSRPSPEVSLRDMVSFGRGTGMSRGRHSATGRSTEIRRSQDDRMEGVEELPSADIRFAQEGLFDGVLQGDQGM